jgi:hypothetical protein
MTWQASWASPSPAARLLAAVVRDDVTGARRLLEGPNAPSADGTDSEGQPLLFLAARAGHEPMVRLLLDHGARVDARRGARGVKTALLAAAQRGHEGVVRALLERGADATVKTKYGRAVAPASNAPIKAILTVSQSNSRRQAPQAGGPGECMCLCQCARSPGAHHCNGFRTLM